MVSAMRMPSGRVFEMDREMIDVSVLSSPDEGWTQVDQSGHEHYWTFEGTRGTYLPGGRGAALPTLREVITGTGYYEDGEPYDIWHYECRQCGETITPRTKPRTEYIAGLASYRIDGELVSPDVFQAELAKE